MSSHFVKAWEEEISIPTYKIGEPDKNPMFLEKRVYQGSSGVIYPHAVIDKIYDEKEDKIYKAVFLENQYLKIMILPELGGRIQMALDKTNNYHFVYYNRVIKPALVGLTGPWISGGIEFNWPQHHRPSTFEPVDFCIEENADGSKTVWVSEIDKMFHTKGMAGFTLHPDKAYLEIKGKLYNRTALPQTFLWWANPAVAVNENYQSVFPPDVHAVFDHGKRDVSSFPIATGTYYKVDYSPGTDISWYKNIPVPTSYMAVNSAFDFVGGYDHGKRAGILHVADHHISPGKKQWTWGCGEFGKAWDRQLTDDDGPYFELMTGMFTDNQPDFGWMMPNEERNFRQYFMPYKNIGYVKNATIDALVNLEINNHSATLNLYVTAEQRNLIIRLLLNNKPIFEDIVNLSPLKTYEQAVELPRQFNEQELKITVSNEKGDELVSYSPVLQKDEIIPAPAQPIGDPKDISTIESLYLAGLHLEQYRHATYPPVAYYEEALGRDPSDIRNNNALGLWYIRHGQFAKAESYLSRAIATITEHNPNPYDGESLYNLGLALFYQEKFDEAYNYFYKACWNAAWQDMCFLYLARIDARRRKYSSALEHAYQSAIKNYNGMQARHLKSALLRKLNRLDDAEKFAKESLSIDAFDFASGNELYLVLKEKGKETEANEWLLQLNHRMRNNAQTYIEIAIDYANAGLYKEAVALLERISPFTTDPFVLYYLSYYHSLAGKNETAVKHALQSFVLPVGHFFVNRLEDIQMLQKITILNPNDYKAWYYLGNLWYDKRQYEEAINAWEKSRKIFDGFATVHRNLGIAYHNRLGLRDEVLSCYEKAFALNTNDARVLFELDQLRKRLNHSPEQRLSFLQEYIHQVEDRDDLYIEYIALHDLTGKHAEAKKLLEARNFHPWEGGEGKVSGQYIVTHTELAKIALQKEHFKEAIELLHVAEVYPVNLGEGKLFGAQENDIHYWLGCAYEKTGDHLLAKTYWEKATNGITEPSPAIFYNDQQPDKIFYQGLALIKLERHQEADHRFNNLVQYGAQHFDEKVKIDYFAVSLPDLMIFDDDLDKRNKIHCHYLMALGKLGLDQLENASVHFETVLKMDASHQGAIIHQKMLQQNSLAAYSE
jgi:tetratricopeptide (TPR) repeat protein